MRVILASVFLVILLTESTTQQHTAQPVQIVQTEKDAEELEPVNNERGKRGFIITPLADLPAAALAPLLPFLRAIVPPPLLAKLAPLLPSAPLVDATALPRILSATAPLIVNRASAPSAAPVVAPTPVAAAVPAPPPVVPVPNPLVVPRIYSTTSSVFGNSQLISSSPQLFARLSAVPFGTLPYYNNLPAPLPQVARFTAFPSFTSVQTVV